MACTRAKQFLAPSACAALTTPAALALDGRHFALGSPVHRSRDGAHDWRVTARLDASTSAGIQAAAAAADAGGAASASHCSRRPPPALSWQLHPHEVSELLLRQVGEGVQAESVRRTAAVVTVRTVATIRAQLDMSTVVCVDEGQVAGEDGQPPLPLCCREGEAVLLRPCVEGGRNGRDWGRHRLCSRRVRESNSSSSGRSCRGRGRSSAVI